MFTAQITASSVTDQASQAAQSALTQSYSSAAECSKEDAAVTAA